MQLPERAMKTILMAGTLAGTLDALSAFIYAYLARGTSPIRVLQYIASGVFGMDAFAGGLSMACWGIAFHFTIAFSWAVLFFFVYPKIPILSRNKIVAGTVYGGIIWLVMNLLVLPLSNVPQPAFQFANAIIGAGILMLAVGMPISFVINKHYSIK